MSYRNPSHWTLQAMKARAIEGNWNKLGGEPKLVIPTETFTYSSTCDIARVEREDGGEDFIYNPENGISRPFILKYGPLAGKEVVYFLTEGFLKRSLIYLDEVKEADHHPETHDPTWTKPLFCDGVFYNSAIRHDQICDRTECPRKDLK